jgi:hypothetical protein
MRTVLSFPPHVADVRVVWDGFTPDTEEPIPSPVNALLASKAPEMAALLRELVGFWPLGGHELEAYIAYSLVPAARRTRASRLSLYCCRPRTEQPLGHGRPSLLFDHHTYPSPTGGIRP